MATAPSLKVNPTAKFATLDVASLKVSHVAAAEEAASGRKSKDRLNKESGPKVAVGVKIGGDFTVQKNAPFLKDRDSIFEEIKARRAVEFAQAKREAITVTLPDGKTFPGTAWETTPGDVAASISAGLAQSSCVAKVVFSSRVPPPFEGEVCTDDGMLDDDDDLVVGEGDGELWDMTRPLEGSCTVKFVKFEDEEGKMVFWHSSAHVLGEVLERMYGSYLTIGPPLNGRFYYDSYMGEGNAIGEKDFKELEGAFNQVVKEKQKFERLIVTKEEALELFAYNPFKSQLIATKVPEGSRTTVYRNGDLVDLCRGPHLPDTGRMKAFAVLQNSATNWLGETTNDSLQRVYATAFPDKKLLKAYQENLRRAEERDHRRLGKQQKLFLFHELSPGCAFWLPHGTVIYNTLQDFIKKQYWERGYTEVISPNIFNAKLWETSGHWQHYAENMFQFEVEEQIFALKPMNCPGHCVMFGSELRSYRDLPMRYADFGVLHRNELSGALTGLTRVRRFQQDDAHIFCRKDQIKAEVLGALDFMKFVYGVFGMTYKLELSTRPKKALGEVALWNEAEAMMAEALNEFVGQGNWRENPGDGAFYGPKIDIKVMDAMERIHQCATVQLDFQLPIRFDLKYKTAAAGDKDESASEGNFEKPIIVHRAMLGSVERMAAVLLEHYGGKWPLWLSPRQVLVVPIKDAVNDYAEEVGRALHKAGYHAEVDLSGSTMQKKVREGQLAQFNFILVVGDKERADQTVNVRHRNNEVLGTKKLPDFIEMLAEQVKSYFWDPAEAAKAEAAEKAAGEKGGKAGGGGKPPKEGKAALKPPREKVKPTEEEIAKARAAKAAAPPKKGGDGGGGGGGGGDAGAEVHAGRLELRVGKILEAWPHPESDKLWCEKIDVGEPEPRLIASGLRAFYSQEEMTGADVVVLANLKSKKLAGFASNGMVMCASNEAHDQVKMLKPPSGAPVGSLVTFQGLEASPASSSQLVKKKIYEACSPDLRTGVGGSCLYKGISFEVEGHGAVTAPGAEPGFHIS